MRYKIDKGIPAPAKRGRQAKYDWGKMKVNDSMFVEGATGSSLHASAIHFCLLNSKATWKFKTKTIPANKELKQKAGVRIWRIA